jgi:hypothetical protein
MGKAHESLHLRQNLLEYEIMDIPRTFIWIIILFHEVFKFGDGVKFLGYAGTNAEPLCRMT